MKKQTVKTFNSIIDRNDKIINVILELQLPLQEFIPSLYEDIVLAKHQRNLIRLDTIKKLYL